MILLHTSRDDALAAANPNHLHLHPSPSAGDNHPFLIHNKAHDDTNTTVVGYYSESDDDDAIWIPPEAAAPDMRLEDAHHLSDDDDDDPSDDSDDDAASIIWCHSSSFSAARCDSRHRDERQKAMIKAMNGQLKMLAARFLESAGISSSFPQAQGRQAATAAGTCCCWLDIVTSLSWEAALLIRPDGTVGKEMDPSPYIKVKCVASGTPRQCEVIKGLVFRKNAAHKHMPTKCHNPRLLLFRGVLGDSDIRFSSFSSIEQEKDLLYNSVRRMMEICSPNVIMVEKTVSRDIQELLLKEGVTLVLDMKLNRLQRISRCSGAPIVSFSEVLSKPAAKLKQCDYFHIEKVEEEEHKLTGEVGKRPSKTLMFLEGFHKPLGCTILLRGANTEELKKIKQVMNYTVFAAYHLVLETSFFEDHRVILNNKIASNEEVSATRKPGPSVIHHGTSALPNGSHPVSVSPNKDNYDLSVTSNGSVQVKSTDGETATISSANFDALNSLEKGSVIYYEVDYSNQRLPCERLVSAVPGSPRRSSIDIFRYQNIYLPITSSQDPTDHQIEDRLQYNEDMASSGIHICLNEGVPVGSGENVDHLGDPHKQTLDNPPVSKKHEQPLAGNGEQHSASYKTSDIDEVDDAALEPQSILILLSSQCITKQVICEHSHLSRIRYYGNFDVSLGRYLQDILQNQNLSCSSCGEPPEAHMYSYTHRNGNLTVLVKRLLPKYRLPGESEGKVWMWTRCIRCEHESGISRSSRRVLMSTEAHYLSFGKFLELSFSSHSTARRLSTCGHSLNRDCLRFFGLGSKVAMFQYSSVEIYTACKPQPNLDFHNPNTHEWYGQEVFARGVTLFSEVTCVLQNLRDQFSVKEFSHLEEMLAKEKYEFMDSIAKAVDQSRAANSIINGILNVNWLYQDLLLELHVWDRRLHQLLECASAVKGRLGNGSKEISEFTGDQTAVVDEEARIAEGTGKFSEPWMGTQASTLLDENALSSGSMSLKQEQLEIPQQFGLSQWYDDVEAAWVWSPLSESRLTYRHEIEVGCLERFQLVNQYCPSHLSPLFKNKQSSSSSEEEEVVMGPQQFTVGPGGSVLCVSENEISSIISCSLAISEERRHLVDAITESEPADSRGRERGKSKTMEKSFSSVSESSSSSSLSWSSTGSSDSEASISSDDLSSYDGSLLSSSLHPEISVNGRVALKGKYSVISVHSNQFYNLRKKCCPSELAYITSLSRCKKWDAQGGKSKAFFAKTMDDRFIIKQIKKTEFESFIEFAPEYFKHVCHSLDTGSQTCLAKILGIYQVKQIRHGKEIKMDLMVMENILFGHNVSRIYDLKGAVFSRHVSDSDDQETVYLDQNFVDDMRVSPIYIGGRAKHLLQRAIWNDTSFLTSINVMDYSLLVGVDKQKHELVFGIIDYLRQYTWDKQLETLVKTSLVVPKNESPTVISPREYKKRFRKFMSKYFLTVPDDWSTEDNGSSVACKPCAQAGGNTTRLPGVLDEKPHHQHPNPIMACA